MILMIESFLYILSTYFYNNIDFDIISVTSYQFVICRYYFISTRYFHYCTLFHIYMYVLIFIIFTNQGFLVHSAPHKWEAEWNKNPWLAKMIFINYATSINLENKSTKELKQAIQKKKIYSYRPFTKRYIPPPLV